MAGDLKTKVVEKVGTHHDFESKLNGVLFNLKHNRIVSVDISTTETQKGTRYVGIILYHHDDSWF